MKYNNWLLLEGSIELGIFVKRLQRSNLAFENIFSSEHIKTKYCGTVIFSLGFSYLTNIINLSMLASTNIKINIKCNGVGMVKEYEWNVSLEYLQQLIGTHVPQQN